MLRHDHKNLGIDEIGDLAFSEPGPDKAISGDLLGKRNCVATIERNLSNLRPIEFSRDHTRKIHSINLSKAKQLESRLPKVKKKMHFSFQTFDVRNPKFTRHLDKEDLFNRRPGALGRFGEMGSYDFEDEERSIEKHKMKVIERQMQNKQRKGESFYIHREDIAAGDVNRKLSMMVSSGNFEKALADSI